MKLTDITDALSTAETSDEPATKKQAAQIADTLTRKALEPLREYVDDLESMLDRAETAVQELSDADGDDREAAFTEVTESVGELVHHLNDLNG